MTVEPSTQLDPEAQELLISLASRATQLPLDLEDRASYVVGRVALLRQDGNPTAGRIWERLDSDEFCVEERDQFITEEIIPLLEDSAVREAGELQALLNRYGTHPNEPALSVIDRMPTDDQQRARDLFDRYIRPAIASLVEERFAEEVAAGRLVEVDGVYEKAGDAPTT